MSQSKSRFTDTGVEYRHEEEVLIMSAYLSRDDPGIIGITEIAD